MSIQTQTLLIKHFIVLVGSWYITSFINTLEKKKKSFELSRANVFKCLKVFVFQGL